MQDHDPNPSRPPDTRPHPAPRSHKSKNAQKRQPQRGLGVAQLEKLRLEEQGKQQDPFCLTSLQQQHHHSRYLQLHHHQQNELHLTHQNLQHEQPFPLPQQTPSLSLCSRVKLIEPTQGFSKSRCSPRLTGVVNVEDAFLPLAAMTNRGQASPSPHVIPPQQFGHASEAYTLPAAVEGIIVPPLGCTANLISRAPCTATFGLSLGEILWHNHHTDQIPIKDERLASSPACLTDMDVQRRDLDLYTTSENANSVQDYLHGGHGSLHLSVGKLGMQHEGDMVTPVDLCLRPRLVGGDDLNTPRRPLLDLPMIGSGVSMRELSSFQTGSSSPHWLSAIKVSSKKRSWECTRELVPMAETSKVLDLNTAADESELETVEPNPNVPVPFFIRDKRSILPSQGIVLGKYEDIIRRGLWDKVCDDPQSPDACSSSATFLSLRKMNLEVETAGEFLSLAPSSSSIQILENVHVVAKDYDRSSVLRNSSENCQPQRMPCEDVQFSIARMLADGESSMLPPDDHQTSYLCTSLQRKIEPTDLSSWNNRALCQQIGDGTLDLELRLSL